MSPGQCSCPDCGTILRVRDRSFVGRQIECPECQVPLLIKLDDERNLVAEKPKVETRRETSKPLAATTVTTTSTWLARLSGIAKSPLALAWALAISLTAFVAIVMLRPAVRFRAPQNESSHSSAAATATDEQATAPDPSPAATSKQSPPSVDLVPAETPKPAAVADIKPVVSPEPATADVPKVEKPISSSETTTEKPELATKPATPVAVPVPVPVKVDVEELLKQRFQKFSTKMPVSRKEMIELVEEMLGAPIRYDHQELGDKNLEKSISLDLDSTTVGGILKALLEPAGWEYTIEETGIRVKPRRVAGTEPK